MRTQSFSSMSIFFQCPLKYKYKYIDRIRSTVDSEALKKGRKVHELISEGKKTRNKEVNYALSLIKPKTQAKKRVRDIFVPPKASRIPYYNEDTKEYHIESFEEGFGLTENLKVVLFDDPRAIYRGILDYYRATFKLDSSQSPMDIVVEITDWKTGKPRFLKKQINSYALMLSPLFYMPKIYGRIVNVTEQKEVKWEITEEILEKTRDTLFKELDIIRYTEDFVGKPSRLCDWCEYKGLCPCYIDEKKLKKKLVKKELPSFMKF